MTPMEAQHHLNVSTHTIYKHIAKREDIFVKRGDKYFKIGGDGMIVVDMENLPEKTSMNKMYMLNENNN